MNIINKNAIKDFKKYLKQKIKIEGELKENEMKLSSIRDQMFSNLAMDDFNSEKLIELIKKEKLIMDKNKMLSKMLHIFPNPIAYYIYLLKKYNNKNRE
ncbi:MAG: hypothetical protein IJ638_00430 [Alphaproteobacteria bacterium]|nr:hypothetical protein [Alphaproteobacteria bacterium]